MKFVLTTHKTNLQNYFLTITLPHDSGDSWGFFLETQKDFFE